MEDITPALVEAVTEDFRRSYNKSATVQRLLEQGRQGTATYAEAQEYALEVSRLMQEAYRGNVTTAVLPDGKMYYNIASRLVSATVEADHTLVADYAAVVQKELNEKAGIGLQVQKTPVDADKVDGLVELACSDEYEAVEQQLLSAFETYDQAVVDETIRRNADLHYGAGLSPKIIRRSTGKCCAWCRTLAGTHPYPVDREIYQRHANCRCTVLYDPADGKGKLQNVHSKKWTDGEDPAILEERKKIGLFSDSSRRYEKDIEIGRSVGAMAMNYDIDLPNGEVVRLTPGSRITKIETIAGKGRNRQIDEIDGLVEKWGGSESEWQKKKGFGYIDYDGESYLVELHWYEEPTAGKHKWKVKPDADGNWFREE